VFGVCIKSENWRRENIDRCVSARHSGGGPISPATVATPLHQLFVSVFCLLNFVSALEEHCAHTHMHTSHTKAHDGSTFLHMRWRSSDASVD
jgi:hypothetical protein